MEKPVVCLGEILWDVLPDSRKPGGAPMNVAYHLRRLGIVSELISRVGCDTLGVELKSFLQGIGLSIALIQEDDHHPTSQAIASVQANKEMAYEIVEPVAWDYLQADSYALNAVQESAVFVFGSLVARNEVARNTLYELIEQAKFRLFDVNLRPPHYTKETILYLLEKAHVVKVNHHELQLIGQWLGNTDGKEATDVALLQDRFQLSELLVTKGAEGVSYYTPAARYDYSAYAIQVMDTIGSGDSFLAAFIAQKMRQADVEDMLDYAAALGAFVTSKKGANPEYKRADLDRFIWEKKLEKGNWK